ncbi:MAG: hypothetical protein Q9165_008886 [Trypethelium subeluteriae]
MFIVFMQEHPERFPGAEMLDTSELVRNENSSKHIFLSTQLRSRSALHVQQITTAVVQASVGIVEPDMLSEDSEERGLLAKAVEYGNSNFEAISKSISEGTYDGFESTFPELNSKSSHLRQENRSEDGDDSIESTTHYSDCQSDWPLRENRMGDVEDIVELTFPRSDSGSIFSWRESRVVGSNHSNITAQGVIDRPIEDTTVPLFMKQNGKQYDSAEEPVSIALKWASNEDLTRTTPKRVATTATTTIPQGRISAEEGTKISQKPQYSEKQEPVRLVSNDEGVSSIIVRGDLSCSGSPAKFGHQPKVLCLGDTLSGKTCLLQRQILGTFDERWNLHKVDWEMYICTIGLHATAVDLAIFDTPGETNEPRHTLMRSLSYPGTDIILLCLDLSTPDASHDNIIEFWMPEILKHLSKPKIILVGTMCDARTIQTVGREDASNHRSAEIYDMGESGSPGQALARKIGAVEYFECSAKTGEGVNQIFEYIAMKVMQDTSVTRLRPGFGGILKY